MVENLSVSEMTNRDPRRRRLASPRLVLAVVVATVTAACLAHLSGLKNLQTLFLDSTQITDAGLVNLKALTNLQTLGLVHTKISDNGLATLKEIRSLRMLFITEATIPDDSIAELQRACPELRIQPQH